MDKQTGHVYNSAISIMSKSSPTPEWNSFSIFIQRGAANITLCGSRYSFIIYHLDEPRSSCKPLWMSPKNRQHINLCISL